MDPKIEIEHYENFSLVVGQERSEVDVYAYNDDYDYATTLAPLPIGLGIVEADPPGIVTDLYDARTNGNFVTTKTMTNSGVWAYMGSPTAQGTFKVQAQPQGYPTVTSTPFTVGPGELRFGNSQTTQSVGQGLKYQVCAYIYNAAGTSIDTEVPVVINFSTSDPGKLQVPASATIPKGGYSACIWVVGLQPTSTPVTVDATSANFASPVQKLSINVTPVTWRIWNQRTCVSGNCTYLLRSMYTAERSWQASLSPFSGNTLLGQPFGTDGPVALSIVEEQPIGVFEGFFTSISGGTPITSLSAQSQPFYIGKAYAPGSYRVRAQLPDGTVVLSDLIYVTQDDLTFSQPTAYVGLGTKLELMVKRKSSNVGGESIAVGCVDGTVCSTPASVVTTNQSSGARAYFLISGLQNGESILTASMPGLTPAQASVVVDKPNLRIDYLPGTVANGTSQTFTVRLTSLSGDNYTIASRVVALAVDVPGIVTIPATVTIPAGSTAVQFTVQGKAKGTVTITATEPGSNPASGSITVN